MRSTVVCWVWGGPPQRAAGAGKYVLHHVPIILQPPHLLWRASGFGGIAPSSSIFLGPRTPFQLPERAGPP